MPASSGERVPIGYYTLVATSIARAELPEPLARRLPHYPFVPATLMGRLAADAKHGGAVQFYQRYGARSLAAGARRP